MILMTFWILDVIGELTPFNTKVMPEVSTIAFNEVDSTISLFLTYDVVV